MIEMANNNGITKVRRVFPAIYAYTARVGRGCFSAEGGV